MNQVEASLNAIEIASMSAFEIVNSTPTDIAIVCPLIDIEALEEQLGVDLSQILGSVDDEFEKLKAEVTDQLALGNMLVDRIEKGVSHYEASISTAEDYMWVVPSLLFAVSVLSSISILGVVLAWKEKSGIRIQRMMSYIVLPLLILVSISCWAVVVVASMGTMIGTGEYIYPDFDRL
jgi:hypothetical protein